MKLNKKMKTDFKKQGKQNRAKGLRFERAVRKDLEEKGWIVSKWQNNVEDEKLVPARMGRFRTNQSGFPDFVCWRLFSKDHMNFSIKGNKDEDTEAYWGSYTIIGVECKYGKYLSKEEKQKCQWLLENNIFSKILVAYDGGKDTEDKRKRLIKYYDFEKKYGDKE